MSGLQTMIVVGKGQESTATEGSVWDWIGSKELGAASMRLAGEGKHWIGLRERIGLYRKAWKAPDSNAKYWSGLVFFEIEKKGLKNGN